MLDVLLQYELDCVCLRHHCESSPEMSRMDCAEDCPWALEQTTLSLIGSLQSGPQNDPQLLRLPMLSCRAKSSFQPRRRFSSQTLLTPLTRPSPDSGRLLQGVFKVWGSHLPTDACDDMSCALRRTLPRGAPKCCVRRPTTSGAKALMC